MGLSTKNKKPNDGFSHDVRGANSTTAQVLEKDKDPKKFKSFVLRALAIIFFCSMFAFLGSMIFYSIQVSKFDTKPTVENQQNELVELINEITEKEKTFKEDTGNYTANLADLNLNLQYPDTFVTNPMDAAESNLSSTYFEENQYKRNPVISLSLLKGDNLKIELVSPWERNYRMPILSFINEGIIVSSAETLLFKDGTSAPVDIKTISYKQTRGGIKQDTLDTRTAN